MTPLVVSLIVLACIFASAVVGVYLRRRFPVEHLNTGTKDIVIPVMEVVVTMTGMVLGLLVASAKSSFDNQRDGVTQLAANVIVLDRTLAHYGPEAQTARRELREAVADLVRRTWPEEPAPEGAVPAISDKGHYDVVYNRILDLQPKTEAQRSTHAHALKIVYDIAQTRTRLSSQRDLSIPTIFLVLIVSWVSIAFAIYGLFAPRHATMFMVLFLGAFVVSSAVFLILELDQGFGGMIYISSQPLRDAIHQLGNG